MLDSAPRFDTAEAARIAQRCFGLTGSVRALVSERDQNFLVEAAGRRAVLKIANAREEPAMLLAQQRAMAHVARRVPAVPRILDARDGGAVASAQGESGRVHLVWAVEALPGRPLAELRRPSAAVLADIGRTIGQVSRALEDFDDPAAHREFPWDLTRARSTVEERLGLVAHERLRSTIRGLLAAFDDHTRPRLAALPRAVIHGDLNDHNILVGPGGDPESYDLKVTGILDFGDMLEGYVVADAGIAAAYALLDAADPLAVATTIAAAYHAERPLTADELGAFWGLAMLRLCLSACMAAAQTAEEPDNDYLAVSQARIEAALPVAAAVPFPLAEAALRDACGLPASPRAAAIAEWLRGHGKEAFPVLGADLRSQPCAVLDLSVASPVVAGDPAGRDEAHLTPHVVRAARDAGAAVTVGRYDEPRLLYVTPLFSGGGRPTDERRTVHLGLDLFVEPGTPVYAPLAGTVHALADNAQPLDYGPVVILRHVTEDGTEFFTLYGHLSRESLTGLVVGAEIARGRRFAAIGSSAVNGGWTPHLHLQVIVDLLGLGVAFPGVGRASRRGMWRTLCPDPDLIVGIPPDRSPPHQLTPEETLAARRAHLGASLRLSYRRPLKIVRGWRQYLFDDTGRQYVDAYNNVPHVGHAHPRVVRAARDQLGVLNTNTRYLSDVVNAYAERLTALFPDPLQVCFLTNSGSEANELAVRLARAHTKARDLIVLEHAYHGNTTTLIDLSPYKHAGPGGSGPPDWVHVAPVPDDYRGPYRREDGDAAARYAAHVGAVVDHVHAAGRPLCGFLSETWPSVAGQLVPPPGYLADVYRRVRDAGGVCIADEVQTGLWRVGTACCAFESQRVVPDIVVLGKPLGNGYPLGAVVTTRAIAASFDTGMEYFNTFGGSTASCAVGLAVLDVLQDEGLAAHVRRVGALLIEGLDALASRHEWIGDVRGAGFFLGIELVRDRATRVPARAEAAYLTNRLRELGILIGTEGPHENVLKIRPPLPFAEADAALLFEALECGLRELMPD